MEVSYLKRPKLFLILLVSGILFLCLTAINIATSYLHTIQSVRLSVANQSMKAASSVARQLNMDVYQSFLERPVEENGAYGMVAKQLEEARQQLGALYIYTLRVNEDLQSATSMIVAYPPEMQGKFHIGDPCKINAEQISQVLKGRTAYSSIIRDPSYGTYMSSWAPLRDKAGQIIGIVGVDTDMEQVTSIGKEAVNSSLPVYIYNGLFVIILVLVILGVQRWYRRELRAAVGATERTYQEELRGVISSIRSIRHDFVNHMQVLYGLIECGYFDKARDYVQSLMKETKLLDITVRVNNPALMVLFHTKWEQAKSRQIVMQFAECPDSFEQIPSIDLIKILSNLIDNAIDATSAATGKKRIAIACRQEKKECVFEVENTGPDIPADQISQLFIAGFSTKSPEAGVSSGMGLSIVRAVVNKHKGTIDVRSQQGVTRFTVRLPMM